MGLFNSVGKVLKGAVSVAAPIIIAGAMPEAVINTAVAGAVKHTPIVKNNNAIPFLNLLLSSGISYVKYATATGDWGGAVVPALQQNSLLLAQLPEVWLVNTANPVPSPCLCCFELRKLEPALILKYPVQ